MASRILIMAANPGRIQTIIDNPLPYPRDPHAVSYQALVERLHGIITGLYMPEESVARPAPTVAESVGTLAMSPLPLVVVREVVGLIEAVGIRGGDTEFFTLTEEMGKTFTRTLLAIKAAELLGLVDTPQGRLVLTEMGRQFVSSARKVRKQLFHRQLVRLPLVKRVCDMLAHSAEQGLSRDVLLEELAIECPQEDPKRLLRILINWGRFAELWTYQSASGVLSVNGEKGHT